MANRYWIGGTGNWSDTAHWATSSGGTGGASVPGSADTARYDGNSGGGTSTIDTTFSITAIYFATGWTGTVAQAASTSFTASGVANFAVGVFDGSLGTSFSVGGTFTISGATFSAPPQMYAQGSITFSSGTFTHNNSVLTLNGTGVQTFNTGTYTFYDIVVNNTSTSYNVNFSTSGTYIDHSLTLTKALGISGNAYLSGDLYSTMSGAGSGAIWLQGTSTTIIDVVGTLPNTLYFDKGFGGVVNLAASSTAALQSTYVYFQGSGTFNIGTYDFYISGFTQTGTTIQTTTGNLYVASAISISGGTFTPGTGTVTLNGTASQTITTLPATTFYNFVINKPGTGLVTLANDIQVTNLNIIQSVNINGTYNINISGNITSSSSSTAGAASIVFNGTGTQYFNSCQTLPGVTITVSKASGNLVLAANNNTLTSHTFTITSGTFDQSTYDLSIDTFTINGGTYQATSGTLYVYDTTASAFAYSSGTVGSLGTSTIKMVGSGTTVTFTGGDQVYANLEVALAASSALSVVGSNTFNNIKLNPGQTIKFTAGSTTTVSSFSAIGTAGNLINIDSITNADHFLAKAGGGYVYCQYCSLMYSHATTTNTWYAANSTDGGHNTNWIFGAPPAVSSANFMLFM